MKILPKFEEIEDAEDFVHQWFNRLLWIAIIGISFIVISGILQMQPPEPEWWLEIEKALNITW